MGVYGFDFPGWMFMGSIPRAAQIGHGPAARHRRYTWELCQVAEVVPRRWLLASSNENLIFVNFCLFRHELPCLFDDVFFSCVESRN